MSASSSAARPSSARAGAARRDWAVWYARRIAFTDLLVIVWAVVAAQLLRFGASAPGVSGAGDVAGLELDYSLISIGLILVWLVALSAFRTREARMIGAGFDEYRQVTVGTLATFGLAAIVFYLGKLDIARGYVLIALPLGLVVLLLSRWVWRQWLQARRRRGRDAYRVILVGSLSAAMPIVQQLARSYGAGYQVLAAIVPGQAGGRTTLPGTRIPVHGDLDQLHALMRDYEAETLILASTDELPPQRVRELSWSLDPGRHHLVMAPNLTDVGGPRIHMRPVAGLPLMHVETPQYRGSQAFIKRAFDLLGAGIAIVVLAIPMAIVAVVVKASSPGPVLYRSERVGYQGRPFKMLKFRSMRVGADQELQGLLDAQGTSDRPLFKIKDDPRVTPVGRFMRRYSIDELPQFFNVFVGTMSLVGPRPQIEAEVALYDQAAHRRLLLKPGVSGLWQVSGRSNLSWDEAIRLDLYYVENWSLMGDIIILWRTVKAVLGRDGAY